jgi:hypothetical protein
MQQVYSRKESLIGGSLMVSVAKAAVIIAGTVVALVVIGKLETANRRKKNMKHLLEGKFSRIATSEVTL